MTRIKTVEVRMFRGIRDLPLDLDGRSLVLEGSNGTGKSSLVQAIEYLFTGRVDDLEGAQSVSLARHGHHVDGDRDQLSVKTTFDTSPTAVERTRGTTPQVPEELKEAFETGASGSFILRRSQLLDFIDSAPAQRFRAIGNLMGIGDLEEVELNLKRVREDIAAKTETLKTRVSQRQKDLNELLDEEVENPDDVRDILNTRLEGLDLPGVEDLETADEYARELQTRITDGESAERRSQLKAIKEAVAGNPIDDNGVELAEEVQGLAKALRERADARVRDQRLQLLRASEPLLEGDLNVCPVCEQEIDANEVLTTVRERVETLEQLTAEGSEMRKSANLLLQLLNDAEEDLGEAEANLAIDKELGGFATQISFLRGRVMDTKAVVEETLGLERVFNPQNLKNTQGAIELLFEEISAAVEEELEQTELTEDEQEILNAANLVRDVGASHQRWLNHLKDLREAKKKETIAERVYQAFSDGKRDTVEEVYAQLAERVNQFFETIHPEEERGEVTLRVIDDRRASTLLQMNSLGQQDEDPRALESEGHLDTLGLCIFLAFYETFFPEFPLLVLDDVVTTVDADHRGRVAHLLMTEFAEDRQMIITTHDGVWSRYLQEAQRAHRLQGNFLNKRILKWSKDGGLTLDDKKPRWERVQQRLDEGRKEDAGNQGRKYFESVLRQACATWEVRVPYNTRGKYSVKDLFANCRNRILDKLKDTPHRDRVEAAFTNLQATAFLGNLLSHDNPELDELTLGDVQMFCQRARELHNALSCTSCGGSLEYNRSKQLYHCTRRNCESPDEHETS